MGIIEKLKELKLKKPLWHKYYTKEERELVIPDGSMYDVMNETACKYPHLYAYNYYGTRVKFKDFIKLIDKASMAFRNQGIRRGDVVSILMPNTPEAVIAMYALNKIGAIAEMIHPLSSEVEIKNYLNATGSVMLVMIDLCYEKVMNIIDETSVYKTIVVSAKDSMGFLMKLGYEITKGFKIKKPHRRSEYLYWKEFLYKATKYNMNYDVNTNANDPAVILHSGGTTGNPKSIVLSNSNFNAMTSQIKPLVTKLLPSDKILGILPIFHGFGLGVSIHTAMTLGAEVILIPQFDARKFDKLLMKHHPNFLVGVPTLFEALTNINNKRLDLSYLKYVVSGGDSLSLGLTRRINTFLSEHNSDVKIIQGYGMTESLAATCVAFKDETNKECSIGIPLPGNYFKIVKPNTQDEVRVDEEGEICVSGPTIMMGYLDNDKETNEVLQEHKDGHVWLHTGDIGYMDKDGVFFYKQRLKRMLISSGFNVYPSQIESVIMEHEAVLSCSVVGISHPYKVQVAKAFVVLKKGYSPTIMVKNSIKEHCKKHLAKYSLPYEYEFRKSLPKTLIGKVDFKKLQDEEDRKYKGDK